MSLLFVGADAELMYSVLSWLGELIPTFVGVFLGGVLALYTGQRLQNRAEQRRHLAFLAAVSVETASNAALLTGVVEGRSWTQDKVRHERPSMSISEAVLSDPSLYHGDIDRGLLLLLTLYRTRIDAVNRVMDIVLDEGRTRRGSASDSALNALRRNCREALVDTMTVQEKIAVLKLPVGRSAEVDEAVAALKRKREELKNRFPIPELSDTAKEGKGK